jgi:hypothetical protein
MKYFLILLTLLASSTAKAQSPEDSVKSVINKMFTGMKNADGAMVKSSFADSAIMQTIARDKDGAVSIRNDGVAGFVDFVGKQKPGMADERISFETIKIDGPLAIVWTPYNFFWDGKFSHCGVNSFQMVRLKGEWKIQYIIDTRRKTGCKTE